MKCHWRLEKERSVHGEDSEEDGRGAQDSQVSHRCDEMSPRAPASGQEEGVGELGARTPISSPPPFSLFFPFISPTHTCHTLSEPGIIRAAGSGIIQS